MQTDLSRVPTQEGLRRAFRALRSRNYRLFFIGQGLSLIGSWMTRVAMQWLVYRLTGSAVLLGTVAFAQQVPAFLIGPFAGMYADRLDKRRLLVGIQAAAIMPSLALAILSLANVITVPQVMVLAVLQGLVTGFDIPVRQSFVVEMVERDEDLANAIALNSSIFNGARLVGPSVAGLIIAVAGEGVCFLLDAVSYIAVILALLAMRPRLIERLTPRAPFLRSFTEGFRYAFGFPPIRAILLLLCLVSLMGMPFTVLLPVFTDKVLHGGPEVFGFLTAGAGSGALIGAAWLAARRSVLGIGRIIPSACILFGCGLIAFSLSRSLPMALFFMFVTGLGMLAEMVGSNTLLQTIVENDKRGRVMAFYTMAFMGMTPFGSLIAGMMAEKFGVSLALALGGAACIAGGIVFASRLRRLRTFVRPIYVAKGILPKPPGDP